MSAALPDNKLVDGYLRGDQRAVDAVDEYIRAALTTWQRKLGADTNEIESDVHYKLLISLRRGEFGFRATLRTFVSRIVNHTCIDFLRYEKKFSRNPVEEINPADPAASQEDLLEKKQAARLLFRALRLLPRECIQLWRMRLQRGMSCAEIGEIYQKTEGNIRRRLWDCRQKAKAIREKLLKRDKPFPD
jgi:RNA polymerase sigma factor (sigma-70 family)